MIFSVLLQVDAKKLPVVLSALEGSATLVSVTATESEGETIKPKKMMRYANGHRMKGISAEALVLEVMKEKRVYHFDEFKPQFKERGFAESSISSTLSVMAKANKVRFLGSRGYCLPGVTVHMGAGK